MRKTCCIFNLAAHYRAPIYKLMDKELGCDFFIGDEVTLTIKKMNYNELSGFKKELKNKYITRQIYWQKGAVETVFSGYKNFIITGEPYCLSTWFILLLTKFTKKKTYLWTHGWYGKETKMKRILKKIYFGLSNHVLLYGNYARNLMIKKGIKAEKLHCIYNSLNYDAQLDIRKSLKKTDVFKKRFDNDYPVLCYVGRIQKVKRLDLLIESMVILRNNFQKPVNLVIVGKESEETNITEIVKTHYLENNVWFYGACYDESKLGEIFYNSNLCVSPGNVGLTAIHALTYGCPVLTHNNFSRQMPEFEVIVPGVTGDFFKENDVEHLAFKTNEWLSYHPIISDTMRNECYKTIDEKYNPHWQIKLLKSLLDYKL
jgi:glycosyltransferase involved in cell wall biosynthesis